MFCAERRRAVRPATSQTSGVRYCPVLAARVPHLRLRTGCLPAKTTKYRQTRGQRFSVFWLADLYRGACGWRHRSNRVSFISCLPLRPKEAWLLPVGVAATHDGGYASVRCTQTGSERSSMFGRKLQTFE